MDLKNPILAALLAWMVPGLGHIYQGRYGKGFLFAICLIGIFAWGMYLGEWQVVYWTWDDERRSMIDGICRLGIGLPALPSYLQSFSEGAGLPVLGDFQAAPTQAELYELNARLNTVWDVAKVCTMIAGLLNVLVILDAYHGPAEQVQAEPTSEETAAA